jgi:hypothetical protein
MRNLLSPNFKRPHRTCCSAEPVLRSCASDLINKGTDMKKISTAVAASALLALSACGGGGTETAANNAADATATENLTLPPDENAAAGAPSDPAAGGETLGNQLNALETTNALGNQVTENGVGNVAASGDNSLTNATTNSQ